MSKILVRIGKSMCIAFSMFSRIPVLQFEWKEEDMQYMMAFFPMVGIVIGGITCLWGWFCQVFGVGQLCFVLVGTALPLLVSGGIHGDGYMDTMDALHSYQDQEKKLEILRDPHIGAFSVIRLIIYYLIYLGAYSELHGSRAIMLLGAGFFLSRILSAFSVVTFGCAKKDGLVYLFSSQAVKKRVRMVLVIQFILCGGFMLVVSPFSGGSILAGSILILLYYRHKCNREFGGITGDTAGYFTLLCEAGVVILAALGSVFHNI